MYYSTFFLILVSVIVLKTFLIIPIVLYYDYLNLDYVISYMSLLPKHCFAGSIIDFDNLYTVLYVLVSLSVVDVCVCVCERERECVCMCVRVYVRTYVCVCVL